jgi:hypothetical protein
MVPCLVWRCQRVGRRLPLRIPMPSSLWRPWMVGPACPSGGARTYRALLSSAWTEKVRTADEVPS